MYKKNFYEKQNIIQLLKKSGIYFLSIVLLFVFIGTFTTISPSYRVSSHMLSDWTSKIESSTFLYLLGMENKAFQKAYPEDRELPNLSSTLFQIATSIKPNDPRSLLGNELPGFSVFDNQLLVAGEGTNYTNLSFESSPPMEEVLKEREAIMEETEEDKKTTEEVDPKNTTGDREVVFIYNTHNYESFLPHLPDVSDPDSAQHKEVNITKVSDRLADSLKAQGIGTYVDKTDNMLALDEKGWEYPKSYEASRDIVKEALATNKDIQYVFDLHRDALSREKTTKVIDGKPYAKVLFVIGEEYATYEKNAKLAVDLHYMLKEKYPGISRGVLSKKGAGTNGIFNQDLFENAILIEMGGHENNLEELYRTADVLAEIFSEYYWDAEKVNVES